MATNNGAVVARAQGTRRARAPRKDTRRRKRAALRRDTQRGLTARARQLSQEAWREVSESDAVEHGMHRMHTVEQALTRFVREQPLKSALICTSLALAAGAGLLLGRALLRRDSQPSIQRFPWQ